MNKLEGFYELNKLSVPTVAWKRYEPGAKFSPGLLWTVRCAVAGGNDLNLPRMIGARADEAEAFAGKQYAALGERGLVVYYPFFLAEVSGTVLVSLAETTVEAVRGDLWHLVTYGRSDYLKTFDPAGNTRFFRGDGAVLSARDEAEILSYTRPLKGAYRQELAGGETVYAEWSFARAADAEKNPVGDRALLFYELRTIR